MAHYIIDYQRLHAKLLSVIEPNAPIAARSSATPVAAHPMITIMMSAASS
jgi:hypothetical protein